MRSPPVALVIALCVAVFIVVPSSEPPVKPRSQESAQIGSSFKYPREQPSNELLTSKLGKDVYMHRDLNGVRKVIEQNVPHFRGECKGSWRLPPNQTRFCKAFDGVTMLSMSRLRRIDIPSSEKLVCDPSSPISISTCQARGCRARPGCLLAVPSPHCRHPAVIVPFASAVHMDGDVKGQHLEESSSVILRDELTAAETALGTFGGYPTARLQQCADVAMQSYCDHAFQLIPEQHSECHAGTASERCMNRTRMTKCVTFRYHFYQRGVLGPLPSHPLFGFLHRSEWRPSLLRDDLRLVLLRGPSSTFRIRKDGLHTLRISVGVRRAFGELTPLGLYVNITATFFVSKCQGASEKRTVLAQQTRSWSSPSSGSALALDPHHAEVEFHMSDLQLARWLGCELTLNVVGEPRDIATSALLPVVVNEVQSVVQYDSEFVRLAHELEEGVPALRHDRASCAPHLRSDECCLNGMTAFHVAVDAVGVPFSRNASAERWLGTPIYLRVTPVGTEGDEGEHPCISIVDGHMTSFDAFGVAVFPWLVVRNGCTAAEIASYARSTMTSLVVFELRSAQGNTLIPGASAGLNLAMFSGCGAAKFVDPSIGSTTSNHAVILVSLAVHERIDVVAQQLVNIAIFAPNSVVVLHVSPFWQIDLSAVYQLNGTAHPHIEVNPNRYPYSKHKLAQVQLSGARHVAENRSWVPWTHVLLFASNELFVRAGVEEHIQGYDMSFPGLPRPRQATSVMHSFYRGARPLVHFVDPELLGRDFSYWKFHKGEGGLHVEFAFNRMLQLLALRLYSTHQLYTEGTFFNRSIAVRLSKVLDAVFDDADGDCVDSWVSPSETFLLQLLQNSCGTRRGPSVYSTLPSFPPPFWNASDATQLMNELESARCGDKTGSVAWKNSAFAVTIQEIFATRCSPFEGPFSLKSFRREAKNAERKLINTIQANRTRAGLLREHFESNRCRHYRPGYVQRRR